jgi:hypothetical protein
VCQFRRRYLLPCHHIFYLNIEQTVLTAEKWRGYLKLFENNGMEVYETIGQVQVPLEDERGPSKVRVAYVCAKWTSNFFSNSMRIFEREMYQKKKCVSW